MKFVLFLTLFVMAKCHLKLEEVRKKCPLGTRDFVEIIGSSKKIGDFYDVVGENYNRSTIQVSAGTLMKNLDDVYTAVGSLRQIFIESTFKYIVSYLKYYCEVALDLIEYNSNAFVEESTIEAIRFNDFDFCVLTFLFGFGYEVDTMFQIMNIFQLLSQITISQFSKEELNSQILTTVYQLSLVKDYTSDSIVTNKIPKNRLNLSQELKKIQSKITKFSKIFCTSKIQSIVDPNFFSKIDADRGFYKKSFPGYINEKEKFIVKFELDASLNLMKTQKQRIYEWDCITVLKSKEYGFENYTRNVEISDGTFDTFARILLKKKDETVKTAVTTRLFAAGDKNFQTETGHQRWYVNVVFTLEDLKAHLVSNNYFLNAVLYSNVASDVTLYALIKEGRKMLAGIKYKMSNGGGDDCGKRFRQSVSKIHRMRTLLSLFRLTFEKIAATVRDKSNVDLSRNVQGREHVGRMEALLKLLDAPDGRAADEIKTVCSEIERTLGSVQTRPDRVGGSDRNESKFYNYHFYGPVYNAFRLFKSL